MTTNNNTDPYSPERVKTLRMLRRGIASPSECAEIFGVSRQVVDYWIAAEKKQGRPINWRRARHTFLLKEARR